MKFPHSAPKGYSYFTEEYKSNVIRIMLLCNRKFDYNLGKPTQTVWGFFHTRKGLFYRAVNYKTMGKVIEDFSTTTPYSSMRRPKLNPLESAFVEKDVKKECNKNVLKNVCLNVK